MRHRYCFSGGISLGSANFSKVFWCSPVCDSAETLVLPLTNTETNIAEFANSVDLDEVAHNEPPHLDLLCLSSSL